MLNWHWDGFLNTPSLKWVILSVLFFLLRRVSSFHNFILLLEVHSLLYSFASQHPSHCYRPLCARTHRTSTFRLSCAWRSAGGLIDWLIYLFRLALIPHGRYPIGSRAVKLRATFILPGLHNYLHGSPSAFPIRSSCLGWPVGGNLPHDGAILPEQRGFMWGRMLPLLAQVWMVHSPTRY